MLAFSRSIFALALVWLCSICLAAGAHAQAASQAETSAAPANDAEYKELIRNALAEMEAHNYAEARALFLRAHALQPSARTLRALGNAEFELKRYAQAIRYFNAALANTTHALTAEMRLDMLRALNRAEAYCGRFELALEPANASLTVDGAPAQLESDGTLLLDLGEHALALTADGYLTSQRTLTVNGGEHARLPWALARSEVAGANATAAAPTMASARASDSSRDDSVLKKWWFWTAVGVVATGAVVGIVVATSGGTSTQAPLQGNLGQTHALLRIAR